MDRTRKVSSQVIAASQVIASLIVADGGNLQQKGHALHVTRRNRESRA